ncbi:MAG: hypothetical protein IKZ87_06100 [Actinomycetaceae bacterium]|nr:hypothetical protein [Actinomycetaceae bacterium]
MALKVQPNPKKVDTSLTESLTKPLQKAPVGSPLVSNTSSKKEEPTLAAPEKSTGVKEKLTVRVDSEIVGRARAAYMADLVSGSGLNSFSAWIERALEQAVEESENVRNGGEEFSSIRAGIIPTGRHS